MSLPTRFQALTAAMGEALALFGGARLTRLTAQAQPGDTHLACERTAGLPTPGQVSVGRVTYRYSAISGTDLTGITALVGGTERPGVIARHPPGAAVLDTSGAYSELDGLRRGLFLGTAEGTDLANLGRSLGVPRSPALASDDQYRAVVKALAYARRGTLGALSQLLDALVGPGNYTLTEDPFQAPGQVQVSVPAAAQKNRTTLGRTYVSDTAAVKPQNGAFTQALPAYGHGALKVADISLVQDFQTLRPSQALPLAFWSWQGTDEQSDVQLLADPQSPGTYARLVGIKNAYRANPPSIVPGTTAELGLWQQVINPTSLAADAQTLGAHLHDGQVVARWGARATATGWQLALVDNTGVALSSWVTGPIGLAFVSLQLTPRVAMLKIGTTVVGRVERSALPAPTSGQSKAAFGNLRGSGQSPSTQLAVRSLALSVQSNRDLWLGRGEAAVCTAPQQVRLPGAALDSRHVGHALWLAGAAATAGARGRFEITSVAGELAGVRGQIRAGGQLVDGNPTPYFVADAASPFTYPDDLGRTVVVMSGGSQVQGSYQVAALYDPGTGADLSALQTPGIQVKSVRAKLAGGRVVPATSLTWRLDPVFAGQSGLGWLLEDAGTIQASAGGQKATPWQPLPSDTADYVFPRRRILCGKVRATTAARMRVLDDGPPVLLTDYPFYATSHVEVLQAYLPGAASSGVQVKVQSG